MSDEPAAPLWRHDCDRCVFLGRFRDRGTDFDLYFADHGGVGWDGWEPRGATVIARFGNDGPAYASGLGLIEQEPALAFAALRAIRRGLYRPAAEGSA